MTTIILFIILLSVIVTIHELGHMLAAKLFGVYVQEFSIGFGPKIVSKQGKETVYSIRAIPLGGYNAMVENENTPLEFDEEGVPTKILTVAKERTLKGVASWKQIIIFLAGPVFNLLLAWCVYIGIFAVSGTINVYPTPVIETVLEGSAAEEAGVQAGDLITKIEFSDGSVIEPETSYDILITDKIDGTSLTLYLLRGDEEVVIELTPTYSEENGGYLMGVSFGSATQEKITFGQAIIEGINYANYVIELTFTSIVGIFTGSTGLDSLGGTISIYNYTQEAVSYGASSYMSLMGSLSISVGLMNLIPITIFDGGHILISFLEMITRKKFSEKAEMYLNYFGLAVVMLLFIFVTYQDIVTWIVN